MVSKLHVIFLGLLISVLAFGGCDTPEPSGTVSGKVTYKGEPVSEAIVTFISTELGSGAEDTLDTSGQYSIKGAQAGIPLGKYKVTIRPPEVEDPSTSTGESPPLMVPKEMPNVPEKYRTEQSTPLEVEVAAGNNEHNFDLED